MDRLDNVGSRETWPSAENRLAGEAAVYKKLLDREILKSPEGVQHFKDVLRPNFVKGAQNVFLWRFFQLMRQHRGNMDFVKWIGKFTVVQKRVMEAWMDLLPQTTRQSPEYLEDVRHQNEINRVSGVNMLDSDAVVVYNAWLQRRHQRHQDRIPLGENLWALVFLVVSDLTETQRE